MALQVEQRPAGDVADHLDLVRPEPDAAGLEALEVVEVAGRRGPPSRRPRATRLAANDAVAVGRRVGQRSDHAKSTSGRAVGRLAERHEPAGEVADPGLLLARQPAELVLDQLDPAPGDRAEVVVGDHARRS